MNLWQSLSVVLIAALVGMFSGPWVALTGFLKQCTFEVFVEEIDRMSSSMAPALTVLLPTAFLSLLLAVFASSRESSNLFYLNATALGFFTSALLVTIAFELPLVAEIVTWAALALPGDWKRTRDRWLRIHIVRVALGFASLVVVLIAGGLQILSGQNVEQ